MLKQIRSLWESLPSRQRLVGVLAVAAVLATVTGIARVATAPDMSLLYSGLDPSASGEVVSALEAEGVPFEVRGTSIYVDGSRRDRVRMDMAALGLPAGGPAGYEILDGLTGFGTTSQMFDAAYWRAKEGELARTITGARNIRAARVHLANPVSQPFSRTPAGSASVTVTMASGTLQDSQAEAVRFLVASAVAGIDPSAVAVIDSTRGVVLSEGEDALAHAGVVRPEERAGQLRSNILRLLEARVGAGNAIVEVNVDASSDSETISERRIDPDSRVAISSELEESKEDAAGAAQGVTVASNLPDGDVQGGGGENNRSSSLTRERQNFEVSETRTERVVLPGRVERINVAVMIDGIMVPGADGTPAWSPRPEEELETLRELVETAAGFNAARGDTVTLETLEFATRPEAGTLAEAETGILAGNGARFAQLGILAGVVLALIFFVLRPLVTRQEPVQIAELVGIDAPDPAQQLAGQPQAVLEIPAQSASKIERLREVISDRSDDSSAILRSWIEAPDPKDEAVS